MTEDEIREIIDRETRAWDNQNLDMLMSIFHQDMVWPWPRTVHSHDPIDWFFEIGRFNYERWRKRWQKLFDSHRLVHNIRTIQKIVISPEGDGAFAVVDVDTLWHRKDNGNDFHWKGRACKVYTKVNNQWKMIYQVGLLNYLDIGANSANTKNIKNVGETRSKQS
jgi:ketosteroid isomerase-like protein